MDFNSWKRFDSIVAMTPYRHRGFSKPPFDSLNLAYHINDDVANVNKNRLLVTDFLKIKPNHLITTNQSHSDIINKVTKEHIGRGSHDFVSGIPGDALYTSESGLAISIWHADCVPVFLYDSVKKIVAIIHAGTPGTLKKITFKAIRHLQNVENVNPLNLYAYIGPSLTFSNNRISKKERDNIIKLDPLFIYGIKMTDGEIFLDVPFLNYLQLREIGIPVDHIDNSNIDTFSNKKDYFSVGRDKITGRHLSIIMLL
jgi:polyphenol oxidase